MRCRSFGLVLAAVVLAGTSALQPVAADPGAAADGPSVSAMYRLPMSTTMRRSVAWTLDAGVNWPAEQQGAEIASFDVRVARTPMTAARRSDWRYPERLQSIAVTPSERGRGNLAGARKIVRIPVAKGQVFCLSSRATDTLGNVGAWESQICITRFLDDRRLLRGDGVRGVEGDRFWGGSASVVGPRGTLLLRRVPQNSYVRVLWAPGSPDGGPEKVRIAGPEMQGRVRYCRLGGAYNKFGRHRQSYCPRMTPRRGPIRILGGGGEPVAIEGVAVTPDWAH